MNIVKVFIFTAMCVACLFSQSYSVLAVEHNTTVYAQQRIAAPSSASLLDIFQEYVGVEALVTEPEINFFAQGLTHALLNNEDSDAQAFGWFLRSAELGYAPAQYVVGKLYEEGEGTEHNLEMAIVWYRKAAKQKHQAAQFSLALLLLEQPATLKEGITLLTSAENYLPAITSLGWLYEEGVKVEKSPELAERYYLRAANAGHPNAMFLLSGLYASRPAGWKDKDATFWLDKALSLAYPEAMTRAGFINEFGLHGEVNLQKAYWLYQQAAEAGEAVAQNNLGLLFFRGERVERNYTLAVELFSRSAKQGFEDGLYHLGMMYENGYGVEVDQATANFLYFNAANRGSVSAQMALGLVYKFGKAAEKDSVQAAYWFKKAAEQNNASAQYHLGDAYEKGLGVEENLVQAVYWLKKAAENGEPRGQYALAWQYEFGRGVDTDYQQAQHYYKLAAEQQHASGMYRLGMLLFNGKGSDFDFDQAFFWIKQAAEAGNVDAQIKLGRFYYDGMAVPVDFALAHHWYTKAADEGDPYAMYQAALMHLSGVGTELNENKAFSLALASAQADELAGNYLVGRLYYKGWGTPINNDNAIKYLRRAIDQGYENAKGELEQLLKQDSAK